MALLHSKHYQKAWDDIRQWHFPFSFNHAILRLEALSAHTSDLWYIHSSVSQATCIKPCLELEGGHSAVGATVVPDTAT